MTGLKLCLGLIGFEVPFIATLIFNGGTSLALFLIVLEVAVRGYRGAVTILEGVLMFATMVAGGAIFGLLAYGSLRGADPSLT